MDMLMWEALSDEKSGLYFSAFAGHHQTFLGSESRKTHEHISLSLFF
jgi:hypothetical protein